MSFENCKNVTLSDMDLYGCGVYGISWRNSDRLCVVNSKIHDCSSGPFNFSSSTGTVVFNNCQMIDSSYAGEYYPPNSLQIRFVVCEFGVIESKI